ncbi:Uncharacterized protein GBIM_10265 [Gryllus bimaculatus]|nr:Uncharacterized protein GBIM_10265 [Gryllus bimaculatus]
MSCGRVNYRYLVDNKNSFNIQLNGSVHVGDPFNVDFQFGNFCVDRTYVREELHTAIVVCAPTPAKMTFWNVICVTVTLTICICVMLFPFIVPKLYTATMKLIMCHMTCEVLIYVFRTIAFAWGDLPMPLCKTYGLKTALLYYYGVVILLVLINIGLFMVTSISIYRTKQEVLDIISAMDNFQSDIQIANREDQRSLVMYLKIFCLMGLTYVTEIIAWYDGSTFTSILMDVNSMLLSIFVFLLFCCKPQVMRNRLEELKQSWHSCCAAR